jgi:hypothetical protein
MRTAITLALVVAVALTAQAEPRKERNHNYILRRQESFQVQGPPTDRLIIGRREIDGYRQRDGSRIWFERDNVVGVTR